MCRILIFCDWRLARSVVFFQVPVLAGVSVFVSDSLPPASLLDRFYTLLIHSSVDGHSDCVPLLPVMNNAALEIYVKFLLDICFHFSLVYTWRWNSLVTW